MHRLIFAVMLALTMLIVRPVAPRPPIVIGPPPAIAPCVGDPVSMPRMCFPR